ncbi:hypothetical protein NUSPORA_00815 [Nucleospora cyclopteri]
MEEKNEHFSFIKQIIKYNNFLANKLKNGLDSLVENVPEELHNNLEMYADRTTIGVGIIAVILTKMRE